MHIFVGLGLGLGRGYRRMREGQRYQSKVASSVGREGSHILAPVSGLGSGRGGGSPGGRSKNWGQRGEREHETTPETAGSLFSTSV